MSPLHMAATSSESEFIELSFDFSGALDTSKIHIVPKHSINDTVMKNAPNKVLNLPFEATFRLQVCNFEIPNKHVAVGIICMLKKGIGVFTKVFTITKLFFLHISNLFRY